MVVKVSPLQLSCNNNDIAYHETHQVKKVDVVLAPEAQFYLCAVVF